MKDIVVLLPGIMGSALVKDGKAVWDMNVEAVSSALLSFGSSLQELVLNSETSTGDGVTATHLMPNAHLIPDFWKIDGYSGIVEFIKRKCEVVPGENFFEFAYDWRLDNRISAGRLKSAVNAWLDDRRSRFANARLILVAHSMGGLVARYFLEVLGGWRDTKMLITLGTPHRGSLKALDFLVNGVRKKFGPLTLIDLTSLIRSCPSAYQLLPIYPCVGKTEQDLRRLEEMTELGELDMRRAHAGVEFHREIERAVEVNLKEADYQARRYKLLPVVGTYQPTFQSALLIGDRIKPLRTYQGEMMLHGDGTVPGFSATPIELSNSKDEIFVACPHASLQNFDSVRTQIRAAVADIDISEIKGPAAEHISLDMPDVFFSGEPFQVVARCDAAKNPMKAVLTNLQTQTTLEMDMTPDMEGSQKLELPPLTVGTYRIRIEDGNEADPITDVFAVLD